MSVLAKYVNEDDSNFPAHLWFNSETYYFISTKLILDWILLRSVKQSNLSLQLKTKVNITFNFFCFDIVYTAHFYRGMFSNTTLFKVMCNKTTGFVFLCHANFIFCFEIIFKKEMWKSLPPSCTMFPSMTGCWLSHSVSSHCHVWRDVTEHGRTQDTSGIQELKYKFFWGKKMNYRFSAKSNQVANMWPSTWQPVWKGTYTTSFLLSTISGWEGSVSRERKMWN